MKAFERYAEYYDLIYKDKDYERECDFIEEVFRRFSSRPIKSILDGGCGTGGHALPLARRGYQITGIDSSEIMLKRATKKAAGSNLSLNFHVADLRQFDLGKKYDTCVCMFAVMGYITETEDILKTLMSVRRHLNAGSIFLFDFWNGLAVLRILPSARKQVIEDNEVRIIRIAQPELDAFNHLCRVQYQLLVNQDGALGDEIAETHVIRYYFPQEIIHYLKETGFEVLKICRFPDIDVKVDESVWNIAAIARAV
ncbi:class I SAM-dependent DNA methyltransferase [Chloroflexota bacterium]